MTSMLLAAVAHVALTLAGADTLDADLQSYAEAHRVTTETGKPMVVMVSTDWCQPCQVMKKSILPRVRERGLLRKVAFAVVNPDRDRDLAQRLTGGGPIPQLVMFRRTADGWQRQKLVGGQSVEAVEHFISEGLAQDEIEKQTAADRSDESEFDDDSTICHKARTSPTEKPSHHG
jgi:thioredoxin-like negative regulator of GroEL